MDADGDTVFHPFDNCPDMFNDTQTDTDDDGHGDDCDCAPTDPFAFAVPHEVQGTYFPGIGDHLYWTTAGFAAGAGTTYDVYREIAYGIPAGSGADPVCLGSGLALESLQDTQVPPLASTFRFFVRATNACGAGSWGNASDTTLRSITACP